MLKVSQPYNHSYAGRCDPKYQLTTEQAGAFELSIHKIKAKKECPRPWLGSRFCTGWRLNSKVLEPHLRPLGVPEHARRLKYLYSLSLNRRLPFFILPWVLLLDAHFDSSSDRSAKHFRDVMAALENPQSGSGIFHRFAISHSFSACCIVVEHFFSWVMLSFSRFDPW